MQLSLADMAELADAHGSGPCESNFMQVQLLLSAPKEFENKISNSFFISIITLTRIIKII